VSVWDTEHGTLVRSFANLKADVNCIEVNTTHGIVYASGVDSRVLSVKFNVKNNQWFFLSLYRGQSHDIKSLLLTTPTELISGGVTTDICVYRTNKGTLPDQFGKQSAQQKSQPKPRHVPPFPFKALMTISGTQLVQVSSQGNEL